LEKYKLNDATIINIPSVHRRLDNGNDDDGLSHMGISYQQISSAVIIPNIHRFFIYDYVDILSPPLQQLGHIRNS